MIRKETVLGGKKQETEEGSWLVRSPHEAEGNVLTLDAKMHHRSKI